ncbi:MAG: WecB/TagA/CpsF family glycosyltransferase [Beijerinckiaceae bacterium]
MEQQAQVTDRKPSLAANSRSFASGEARPGASPSLPSLPSFRTEPERDVVCLFGLAYDRVTLAQAVEKTRQAIEQNDRLHIATPNMNLVRMARSDRAMHGALLSADLVIADGMPLVWLARFMGLGLKQRVAGSDLFDALHAQKNHHTPTFFFGGTEESAQLLLKRFPESRTGIEAVGATAPGFGSVEDMGKPDTLASINAAKPSVLVVSVSARKGLLWIARNERMLNAPVIANLGAVIHFATGSLKRAPNVWQRSGFEWLWRIRQEPELWSRYASDFRTLTALSLFHALPARLMGIVLNRLGRKVKPRVRMVMNPAQPRKVIQLEGSFTQGTFSPLVEALALAGRTTEDVTLDLTQARHLDASAVGQILVARGQFNRMGRNLSLTGAHWWMRLWLKIQGCGFLLNPPEPQPTVLKQPRSGPLRTAPISNPHALAHRGLNKSMVQQ